jgi:hypothetical protein
MFGFGWVAQKAENFPQARRVMLMIEASFWQFSCK